MAQLALRRWLSRWPLLTHVTGIAGVVQSKKGLTSITIAFDETLNPGSAENMGFYSDVLGAVKKHRKTVYTKGVPIRGVTYDGIAQTVTITLAKPYKGAVQVMVLAGIVGTNGTSSSGAFSTVVP